MFVGMDGEHDHRNVGPRTNALEHLGAFQVRQVEIENDQIGRPHRRSLEARGGILRFHHCEAMKLEACAQKAPDLCLIVDDQHLSHRVLPTAPAFPQIPSATASTSSCRDQVPGFSACRLPPLAAIKVLAIH
jgi:hypothetical protein